MIKDNNGGIQRELEIDKGMDSCSSGELVNCYRRHLYQHGITQYSLSLFLQSFMVKTYSAVLQLVMENHSDLYTSFCLSLFWDCLNQGWLNDPSIRISKEEPRGNSEMAGNDSWGSGDNRREEQGVEDRRRLKCWGVSGTATTGVFL